LTPFESKYQIVSVILLAFVDASEDSIMVNDVATPSNLPIALVEEEELEETPLDVNVSQLLRKEEPSIIVVHTRIHPSAWNR
jgi:hypothetical protein